MAIWRRRPPAGKTICHSDHGSQYTSRAFGRRLRAAGLLGSMGTIGDCFDNSLVRHEAPDDRAEVKGLCQRPRRSGPMKLGAV